MKQTLDQHIESGSLSSEITSSASQVDSPQPIITSPGKDIDFLTLKPPSLNLW